MMAPNRRYELSTEFRTPSAIPTGVPIHRSAPACWQTAVESNGPRPAEASSTVRVGVLFVDGIRQEAA